MDLIVYNTLTRKREPFVPQDPNRVTLYVCGPTVYNNPHIGNARPPVLFGLLFPLFGIALLVVGRLLATWQESRLIGRLDRLFDAAPYSKARTDRGA